MNSIAQLCNLLGLVQTPSYAQGGWLEKCMVLWLCIEFTRDALLCITLCSTLHNALHYSASHTEYYIFPNLVPTSSDARGACLTSKNCIFCIVFNCIDKYHTELHQKYCAALKLHLMPGVWFKKHFLYCIQLHWKMHNMVLSCTKIVHKI